MDSVPYDFCSQVGDSLEFPGGLEEFEGLWGAAAGNLAPRTCCTFFLSSAKNPNVWLYGFVLNEGGILTIDEIKQRDLRGLRIGTINLTFLDPKLYLFKVTAEVLVSNLLPFACRFFGYAQEFVFSTYQLPSNPAVENSIFQTVYSFHEPRNVALSYSGQQSQQFLAQLLKSRKLEILMLRYYWPTETLHTVFTRLKETQIKVFYTRVCDAKINTALLTEMHNFWISGQFESTKVDLSFRAGHLEGVDDMFPDKKEYGVDKQWNVEHILYGTFELTVMGNYSLEVKINPAT